MPVFLLPFIGWIKGAVSGLLTFCSKPPGIYIAAAVAACLGLWWFGHLKYAAGVAAAVAAASARSAQVKAKQDKAIAAANAGALIRAIESAKLDNEEKEAVAHVKEAAANMPDGGSVAITADVADRLRDIK